jgi:hypothetical protein
VVNRLLADQDDLRRRQWDTLEWWRAKCSPEATANVVADAIRKADRAQLR